ncbi:protein-L-isoaspartate(D-aspartate) O-methyltransferase [Streptomyces sp. MNP-20]|uniref:protein-L-isoaspartate(D-aspartate) O-methyltransferase n=1 Tax=Streptomyces sp. MNP-20 TaxID=2721165 RepID=UPI001552FFC7|nr:protein-L-isoaspartate(D-aspartate) O-methyltransferase [Streptomyces sp. MNP-20]
MNWKSRAQDLADTLTDSGELVSPHWYEAFAATPRHRFVPAHYQNQGGTPTVWRRLEEADGDAWLHPIYTNSPLVTRLEPRTRTDGGWHGFPAASSSQPTLTARMLEALAVEPGDDVLDAGLGTGYQAALMCHHLDDARQLTTADLDPEETHRAQARLEGLGYCPDAVVADATTHAWDRRFQRVIVTFGIPEITDTLKDAVAPGGRLIANVLGPLSAGLAVLDALPDGILHGRFHPDGGTFMPARHADQPPADGADLSDRVEGMADVRPEAFTDYSFTFLLAAHLPGASLELGTDDDGHTLRRLVLPDGAWAQAIYPEGERPCFHEAGGHNIWETTERAWTWFTDHGSPTWERFGLTVTAEQHRVWFETPDHTVATF